MSTKHTPGPWKISRDDASMIRASDGSPLAFTGSKDLERDDINAAFIVRACNNHEALLAALIQIRDMDYVPQFAERVAELARAAIEACEVQS